MNKKSEPANNITKEEFFRVLKKVSRKVPKGKMPTPRSGVKK